LSWPIPLQLSLILLKVYFPHYSSLYTTIAGPLVLIQWHLQTNRVSKITHFVKDHRSNLYKTCLIYLLALTSIERHFRSK